MKKWKRWKLGKNIEEEYRHTHSQLPHMKGSIVGHPPCPPKPPEPSNPPSGQEENRQLVGSHPNGMGKTPTCLPFPLSSQDGSSHSTLIESINLEDRVQCYVPHHNSMESNFWAGELFSSVFAPVPFKTAYGQRCISGEQSWNTEVLGPAQQWLLDVAWPERHTKLFLSLNRMPGIRRLPSGFIYVLLWNSVLF